MSQPAPARIHDPRAGMTLVEVLVTLAIVGVLTTMVVLGMGLTRSGSDARTEANLLAGRLGVAVDEALVSRRPVSLSWDAEGYGLMTTDDAGRWTATGEGRHRLPAGLTLGGNAPNMVIVDGDGGGSAIALSIGDERGGWTVDFDGLTATTRAGSK